MATFDNLKSDLAKLHKSDELKKYIDSHKGAYLVSAFFISSFDDKDVTPWVLEYYSPESSKVCTFTLNDKWEVTPDDSIFQREPHAIMPLEISEVKFKEGAARAKEELTAKFSGESPLKVIVILGTMDKNPQWNITVFTKSFKVINFRIDAVTGETKSSTVDNLLNFQKKK